jgi:glc operon protein GlcG
MMKLAVLLLSLAVMACAADLPSKKWLNLAALKKMVAAAEAEAAKRNVQVTICIVDESGNLLFLQKADGAGLNTIQFAQKKARYAAIYSRPSAAAAEQLKGGNLAVLAFPDGFPNQGGVPIKVDGHTIGGIACSGAASEVDEAISQTAVDALLK